LCVGRMQCAPTFGAVPSAADVKKKQEEAAMVEEKRDEILMQLMNKEVAMRLNAMEVDNPAKVQTRCSLRAQTKCVLTFIDVPPQVSRVRDQILAQRAHWRLNGPFNEQNLAELLKNMEVILIQHPLLAHLLVPLTSRLRAGDH